MRTRKPPKSVRKVVEILQTGKRLCRGVRKDDEGNTGYHYFYEPGGRTAHPGPAEKAIALGLVRPCGDALFHDMDSQTWEAA
jgi:hypothetical protein